MIGITPFDPFELLTKEVKPYSIKQIIDDLSSYDSDVIADFVPTNDNKYLLKIEVGNTSAQNINIEFVSGNRNVNVSYKVTKINGKEDKKTKNSWNAVNSISYEGCFNLPLDADSKTLSAKVVDGFLVITADKKAKKEEAPKDNIVGIRYR